uniref:Uncharacterized protein n=1 Tax=Cannabis sativa TaxID=3483 RepID=A0A803NPH0_CANSA
MLAFSGVANSGGAVVPLATFSADGGEALKDKHVRVHRRPRRPLSATAHAATASGKAQRGVWFPKRSSAGCVNGTSILSNVDETGFLENEKGPANLSVLRENEVDRSFGEGSGPTVLRGELEGDFGSGPKTVGPKSVGNGPNDVGSGLSLKVVYDQLICWLGAIPWPSRYNGWTEWLNNKGKGLVAAVSNFVLATAVYEI